MSASAPGYWINETSGALVPAVTAYLNDKPMTPRQIAVMRAYLRQWMTGPWQGPMIDVLRSQIEEITTRADIDRWLDRAFASGIDPL